MLKKEKKKLRSIELHFDTDVI